MSRAITGNYLSEPKPHGRSRSRLHLYILAFAAYWYAPVVYGMWLWHDLKMGALSTDSDAVAIPLLAFVFLWFVGFPFFLLTTVAFEMLLRRRDLRRTSQLCVIRARG